MASTSYSLGLEKADGAIAAASTENIPHELKSEPFADIEIVTDEQDGNIQPQHRDKPSMTQRNVAHSGSVQIVGNISDAQLNFFANKSLFGSLNVEPHETITANVGAMGILAKKVQFQTGRVAPQFLECSNYYAPYAFVENRKIRSRLFEIAERFQFLDRGFAEYFQVVVPSYNQDYVRLLLDNIRRDIASKQNSNSNKDDGSDTIYLGDLGHFCEEVSQTWSQPTGLNPTFTVTHRRDEVLHYLQDALEVPYWKLMVDLFLGWRANIKTLSGEVVLRALDNVKHDILDGKRQLLDDLEELEVQDKENIKPIVQGINLRLRVLESVWDKAISNLDKDTSLASLFERPAKLSVVTIQEQSRQQNNGRTPPNETVILVALILVFLVGAITPGYKAFALSMQKSGPGSTEDAEFWYLIQCSIMAVLGNVVMVVPLLKKSWLSPAYSLMWTFFMFGLAFSAISIIIYPLVNTGWSAMVSFLGSIASAASVLVMTQATSKTTNRAKVKSE